MHGIETLTNEIPTTATNIVATGTNSLSNGQKLMYVAIATITILSIVAGIIMVVALPIAASKFIL